MPMPMQETEAEKFFLFFFRHHKNGIINKFSMSKVQRLEGKIIWIKVHFKCGKFGIQS